MPSKSDEKIPLKTVKQLPYQTLNRMINKARKYLKEDETWKAVCKEYGETPDIIDFIPIRFGNLDVSAKTDHAVIILNYRLLCDGDFFKDFSYLVHEGSHWLQQTCNDEPTQGSDEGSYLDNPDEQEGFQNQIEFIADHFGKDEAENYVDDLLTHHDIEKPKEREEKKEILMSKV